jgi:serine/threonine protein kinase
MAADPSRVRDLFLAAYELPPEERVAYLDSHCPEPELRRAVERLLAAHDNSASLLEPPTAYRLTASEPSAEGVGTVIGPYKLMEQIGEGGFGRVFVAEQTEPLRRKVALKLIKPGMDSTQIVARFEAERQALALMDHPNIARVLDAGATESGRPYFVMELVRGVPITDYCDKHQLTPRQRLELFLSVCQAIQHAHQKGIIHRDIKPSNVLVTAHDGQPVAKVIDFGVAKALHQQLSTHTIYTGFAQMIGTPLYMSPEQAEMSGLDIDTRTDIYSLGVLLYELLTGSTPLERQQLAQAAFDEIRRLIREVEPPRPSLRLSSSDSLASIAALRHTEPAKLSRLVRGDLDWITMKALEKDRTRRYETANGLARDIQRHLCDEPVEASPPSTAYRLRKFARKHRTALATAAALILLLLTGILVSTWQAVRALRAEAEATTAAAAAGQARAEAERQKDSAEQAATREAEERVKAVAAKTEAQRREAEANAVVAFFEDKVFAAGRPKGQDGGLGHEVLLREAIHASLPALSTGFLDQPLVEAHLRLTLGNTFTHLGDFAQAAEQYDRARALFLRQLSPDHPETLKSMGNLANSYADLNRHAEALQLREETLAAMKRVLGPDHPDTLKSMNSLADSYATLHRLTKASKLLEETLAARQRVLGPDHPDTLTSMGNLALSYRDLNRHAEALQLGQETLAARQRVLGLDHPDTLTSRHNVALSYQDLNRHAEALQLGQETLAARQRVLPLDHPDTLKTMNNLALSYAALNRQAEAIKLNEETLAARQRVLPPDHPDTLTNMSNLAVGYTAVNRHTEASKLLEQTLAAQQRVLPPDHPGTLKSMNNLANSYHFQNRYAEALQLRLETLAAMKRVVGPDHPDTLKSMNSLANSYQVLNRHAEALQLREETLAIQKRVLPPDHLDTLMTMTNLANSYAVSSRQNEALKLREETLAAMKRVLPPDHPETLRSMHNLALSYTALKRHTEAIKLVEETLAARKRVLPPDHPDTLQSMNTLAVNYLVLKRYAEASKVLEETLAGQKRVLPPDHPDTLRSMVLLGTSYIAVHRDAEALPLIDSFLAQANRPGVQPALVTSAINLRLRHFQKADDPAGCRATAEMWEKLERKDAASLYQAGVLRTVTASVQARAKEPDAAVLTRAEADRAMTWLTKAVAAGFTDANRLRQDKDLDFLRDREDFQKLVADLEQKKDGK